jgi:CBS domain-containing protein
MRDIHGPLSHNRPKSRSDQQNGPFASVPPPVGDGTVNTDGVDRNICRGNKEVIMLARDVMTRPVISTLMTTSVIDATHLLIDNGFTALPVLDADDGRLVGIITEADLLRDRIAGDPRRTRVAGTRSGNRPRTVADVMTSPVESLTAGADISDAARIMVDERIRCLPIVDGYGVVGVITRRDLLRAAAAMEERLNDGESRSRAAIVGNFDPDCP